MSPDTTTKSTSRAMAASTMRSYDSGMALSRRFAHLDESARNPRNGTPRWRSDAWMNVTRFDMSPVYRETAQQGLYI